MANDFIGYCFYRGPSMLDGSPIIAIANGFDGSINPKTGDMIQTWIIREDIAPNVAVKNGTDTAICGECIHRKKRTCYVPTHKAPLSVFNAFHRGRYVWDYNPEHYRGLDVRFGSYGDPAAVPLFYWTGIKAVANSTTGYTHQWKRFPQFASVAMASVESLAERLEAKSMGFRTFRVRNGELEKGEVVCPASKEGWHKLTCQQCKACGGTDGRRGDIAILPHGFPKIKLEKVLSNV